MKQIENFEARLKQLREERSELYTQASDHFELLYGWKSREFLSSDKELASRFRAFYEIAKVELLGAGGTEREELLIEKSLSRAAQSLALNHSDAQQFLILWCSRLKEKLSETHAPSYLSLDSLFPIIEDIVADGEVSREEVQVLDSLYQQDPNFNRVIAHLPQKSQQILQNHLGCYDALSPQMAKNEFCEEFHNEIQNLQLQGVELQQFISFFGINYFKIPARISKRETHKRRLRRTMKMALLRMLKYKYGTVDIEKLMRRFENCESFEDYARLFLELFEILSDKGEGIASFHDIEETQALEKLIRKSTDTKKKVIQGESCTAKITSLLSEQEWKIDEDLLAQVLSSDTHLIWEEFHFHYADEMAGIYAQSDEEKESGDELEEELKWNTLEGKYELLKNKFYVIDEAKRQAFLAGEYERVDEFNEMLYDIESKLHKLNLILGIDQE